MRLAIQAGILVFALLIGFGAGPALAAGGDDTPTVDNSPYGQAKGLIDAKNYAAAVPLLEKAVPASSGEKKADALNLLAYSLRKLGKFEPAERYYEEALAIKPDHRGALEYLGELYLETGRRAKAEEMLKRLGDACFFGCEEYDELKELLAKTKG